MSASARQTEIHMAHYDPASKVRRATSKITRGDEPSYHFQDRCLRALREHAGARRLSNPRSNQPGGDVDRKGQHRAVEKERQDAMNERHPPHRPRRNDDIGGLTRDADHVRKI
jgi:hypothetical protein